MEIASSIPVIVGIALLLILFMVVAASRGKEKMVPNYRAMFVLGICFMPIGIASDSSAFLPLGIVFMLVGLKNKDKWGQETRWVDFPPRLKRIKLIFAGALTALLLAAIAWFVFSKMN